VVVAELPPHAANSSKAPRTNATLRLCCIVPPPESDGPCRTAHLNLVCRVTTEVPSDSETPRRPCRPREPGPAWCIGPATDERHRRGGDHAPESRPPSPP